MGMPHAGLQPTADRSVYRYTLVRLIAETVLRGHVSEVLSGVSWLHCLCLWWSRASQEGGHGDCLPHGDPKVERKRTRDKKVESGYTLGTAAVSRKLDLTLES